MITAAAGFGDNGSGGLVERAVDAEGAAVEDVGVDHGGGDVAVAEELLDGADVVAGFEQVSREAVPQAVASGVLRDLSGAAGITEGALEYGFVQVVPSASPGRVIVVTGCRKDPLPRPFLMGKRELVRKRPGQLDVAGPIGNVPVKEAAHLVQVSAQRGAELRRQERDAVSSAFAVTHEQLASVEIDVLHTQAGTFEEP